MSPAAAGAPRRSRAENVARTWAGKYAGAQTLGAVATVEFDRARAAVRRLPEKDQPGAWKELAAAVVAVRSRFEGSDHR